MRGISVISVSDIVDLDLCVACKNLPDCDHEPSWCKKTGYHKNFSKFLDRKKPRT